MKYFFKSHLAFNLFCFLLFNGSFVWSQEEVTTYYLIRHAEKEKGSSNTKNPHLSQEGHQRALKWKTVFSEIDFDQVYSTDFYRTQETAAPTAQEKNIPITFYDPRELYNSSFKQNYKGKTVLVVGHSNTTPILANKIIGIQHYPQIEENTFGKLYILQIHGDTTTHQLLNIE